MNKKWVIGCGIAGVLGAGLVCTGIVVLVIFGVAGIFGLTQPVVDAGNEFPGLLGQGKTAEAYASTASGFAAQQDEPAFTAAVKKAGLTDYASVIWTNRQMRNQEGSLEGTVTTKTIDPRNTTPPHASPRAGTRQVESGRRALRRRRFAWGLPGSGVRHRHCLPEVREGAAPGKRESAGLSNEAVKAKDFAAFHGKISDVWQKQFTPQGLKDVFQVVLDQSIDIGPIKNLDPVFDPPAAIDAENALAVSGLYPTQPSRVKFRMRYVREATGWKLCASLFVRRSARNRVWSGKDFDMSGTNWSDGKDWLSE